MTSSDDLRLAELLCARLCHDLSGPVGAASAGAELFEDLGGDVDAETMALVAESAAGAAARLKFFRQAFGPAASAPQPSASLRELIDAYFRTAVSAASPGLVLDWRSDEPSLDGETARLLLNLVLIAKDCLPRGGGIAVTARGRALVVVARGEPMSLTDEARDVLMNDAQATGPRGAQARFARVLGQSRGQDVVVSFSPEGLVLTADGPAV